jgi:adenylate kinase
MQLPSLIVLGAPGSGKGTQAEKISKHFGYTHLSTGDLLRSEIERKSELGSLVQGIISRGDLVGDDVMLALLKKHYVGIGNTVLLDGFPRNIQQATMLDKDLFNDPSIVRAVYFKLDLSILKERIVNRRTCKECNEIYNLVTKPLSADGSCLKCGSKNIVHRKDDAPEVVENRLKVFSETFEPILDYYRQSGRLLEVDAQQTVEKVFSDLVSLISI